MREFNGWAILGVNFLSMENSTVVFSRFLNNVGCCFFVIQKVKNILEEGLKIVGQKMVLESDILCIS